VTAPPPPGHDREPTVGADGTVVLPGPGPGPTPPEPGGPAGAADIDGTGGGGNPLAGMLSRGRLRGTIAVLGPAFVASVAYVDPGNFATNIAGGSKYGYMLLWVLLGANLMGMLVQTLSAKMGIATGKTLPELCREHFARPVTWGLWVQAELIAMATDLAEFVGAAIALNLLFHVPLFSAGVITALVAFGLLALQSRGYRRFEIAITGLLAVILLGFLYNTLRIGFDAGQAAQGFIPSFDGTESILLATGILGATVMPHAIYLHSSLTAGRITTRDDAQRRRLMRFERWDVLVAMALAGLVNMAMLIIAASLFHSRGLTGIDSIDAAYHGFDTLVGPGAALAFALALLASGLASSSVATYAGQVVMQGFINRRIALILRRGITMIPALIVLAVGVNPSRALVLSQVVLSFGIPFALIPLVLLTRRHDVMGALTNNRWTTALAWVVAAAIVALNVFLLYDTFFG
jgi:manganese transport protein